MLSVMRTLVRVELRAHGRYPRHRTASTDTCKDRDIFNTKNSEFKCTKCMLKKPFKVMVDNTHQLGIAFTISEHWMCDIVST